MHIEFALNSHSWHCDFNAHCARSDEHLGRSDSMQIKGMATPCHVKMTRWQTAWKWRPFSAFVFLSESTRQTSCQYFAVLRDSSAAPRGVGCGMGRNFITWLPHPCPRILIEIRFESTFNPPPDVDWTSAHSMRIALMCIALMRIQWSCMWTRTKRIQCVLNTHSIHIGSAMWTGLKTGADRVCKRYTKTVWKSAGL